MLTAIVFGALNALWITGCWNALLPGQILGEAGDWMAGSPSRGIDRNLPEWLTKPTFECPMCMASVHGLIWWICFDFCPWFILPFYVVCLSGLMKLLVITVLSKDKED